MYQKKYLWLMCTLREPLVYITTHYFTGVRGTEEALAGYENTVQLMAYHLHLPLNTLKTGLSCACDECVYASLGWVS